MARPPKSGLAYFPMDVDMDADEKVAYIVSRHGFLSFGLIVKLYMEIYRRGYFMIWNERQRYLLAHQLNIDADFTETVVSACLNEGIFDENSYNFYSILTSHGIQYRYMQAAGRRISVRFSKEIFLLDEEETKGMKVEFVPLRVGINAVSVDKISLFDGRNTNSRHRNNQGETAETGFNADKNPISADKNEVFSPETAKPQKNGNEPIGNNNPVSVDRNPSFSGELKNDTASKFVSADNNLISADKNPDLSNIPSTETPQIKVNITTTTTTTAAAAANKTKVKENDFAEVAQLFQDNIHPIVGDIDKDKLTDLLQDFGKKWLLEAIKEAAYSNVRNIKYITAILDRWQRDGFKTPKAKKQASTKGGSKREGTGRTRPKVNVEGIDDFDEAEERMRQNRPWDVQSDPGGTGAQQEQDTPL